MNNREIILNAIDYIEEHLEDEISIFSISKEFGYSMYHFIRLFSAMTGHTPNDYIQRRRLSEASKEIYNTDKKIIDIAMKYQFNSHENFSRAFKKMVGMSPTTLRKKTSNAWLTTLKPLSEKDIQYYEDVKSYDVSVVELDSFEIKGMSTFIDDNPEDITKLWDKYSLVDKKQNDDYYQLQYWSKDIDLKGFFVMVGRKDGDDLSLTAKKLPRAKYLKFVHKGLSNEVYLTYKYIYQTYLPKSDYKLSMPYAFEVYGRDYLGPDNPNSRSEIYIPIE